MEKKIKTEIALGIILIVAIVSGGLIWFLSRETIPSPVTNTPPIKNEKPKGRCGSLKEFENYDWFKEMVSLYKDKLENDPEMLALHESKFYLDYPHQACLFSDYFVFIPYEIIGGVGPLYSYNLKTKKLVEAPGSREGEYMKSELKEINDEYVLFEGGGGSGECFSSDYGKYYYKLNKVEIFKKCAWCMKDHPDEKDCREESVIKVDFSLLNKDELLHKLFPNLTFTNGVANPTPEQEHYEYSNLYLQNSIEDYFVNNQEKHLLLIVKLDGVAHAGGLYHAYLGLFDKNGNLLTPASPFSKPNVQNPHGEDYYEFFEDKAQFGGDMGDFRFYDCKGIKYIVFVSSVCPNGSCCFGRVGVFRINNGEFEKVQTIDERSLTKSNFDLSSVLFPSAYAAKGPSYGLKMILSDEKIIVKKVPPTSEDGCPETDFKELKWNQNSCRFE